MLAIIIIMSVFGYLIGGTGYYLSIRYLGKKLGYDFADNNGTEYCNDITVLGVGSALWPISTICWLVCFPFLIGRLIYEKYMDKD